MMANSSNIDWNLDENKLKKQLLSLSFPKLIKFCKQNKISYQGNKKDIIDRLINANNSSNNKIKKRKKSKKKKKKKIKKEKPIQIKWISSEFMASYRNSQLIQNAEVIFSFAYNLN